jgi:hypothetical protein
VNQCAYNHRVSRVLIFLGVTASLLSQEAPKQEPPPVKVNIVNVCTPVEAEQDQIKAALSKVPEKPSFTADFEVSRGRTSAEEAENVKYLRLRRDMDPKSGFATTQYSLSVDPEKTIETLVFRAAEGDDDLHSVILEDQVSTGASPASTLLAVDTPASRIKIERFGKPPIGLSRCEADQSAYEPIFAQASKLLATYRKSLGLRGMFRGDLTFLAQPPKKKSLAEKAEAIKNKP